MSIDGSRITRFFCTLVAVLTLSAGCGDEEADNVGELQLILPAPPQDFDQQEVVAGTGATIDDSRLNRDETHLWCEPVEGVDVVRLLIGDVWATGAGAGVILEFEADAFEPGEQIRLPSAQDFMLFVVDVHDDVLVPEEYSSTEEESSGSITLETIPCGDGGDELALVAEGAIGAETNPGYRAALSIVGRLSATAGDRPSPSVFDN